MTCFLRSVCQVELKILKQTHVSFPPFLFPRKFINWERIYKEKEGKGETQLNVYIILSLFFPHALYVNFKQLLSFRYFSSLKNLKFFG